MKHGSGELKREGNGALREKGAWLMLEVKKGV